MTRRIVIAILLTVIAMLLLSDAVTYWTIRSVLLEDLDQTILARVTLLPQIEATGMTASLVTRDAGDRYVIENAAGQNLARTERDEGAAALTPRVLDAHFTAIAGGQRYRTLTIRAAARPPAGEKQPVPVTVVYSASAAHFDSLLNRLLGAMLLANVLVALGAALVARRVSSSALRPLQGTAEVIGTIDERHLDRRIVARDLPPELTPMAERLNEMLQRLEESLKRRRHFIADASHELRAPVAALLTTLEVCLRRPRDSAEYQRVLNDCLANTRVLRSLVEMLMEQVKSEQFRGGGVLEPVDLNVLLPSCIAIASAIAVEKRVQVASQIGAVPCVLTAPERLRSIIINLLTNAVEYNRPGGCVELLVRYAAEQLEIEVADTGVGIAEGELARVVEPFYRTDKVRKPGDDHHLGLGLFLVKTHLDALGGSFAMESKVGEGTRVRIKLPAREAASPEGGGSALVNKPTPISTPGVAR